MRAIRSGVARPQKNPAKPSEEGDPTAQVVLRAAGSDPGQQDDSEQEQGALFVLLKDLRVEAQQRGSHQSLQLKVIAKSIAVFDCLIVKSHLIRQSLLLYKRDVRDNVCCCCYTV